MKLKIILFAFLISALAACSVEQDIFDTLTTENSLKNQGNITTFVNGAYARFSGFNGFKTSYMTYFYSADDLNTRPGAAYASRYSSKTQDAFSTEVSNFWSTLYQTINSTNFLIENIDPVKADSLYKRRVKGEMYFLRGFSYFYLVRMWGGVPLKTKPTNLDDDLKLPRSSVDQIYTQIFADFEEANKRLLRRTSLPSAEFGHATKGAAQAFLSKAYLTYGNYLDLNGKGSESAKYYQLAKNYADSVITSGQYSLIPSYKDLWDVDKEAATYQEVIFGIQFTRDAQLANSSGVGSEHGLMNLPNNMNNVGGRGTTKTGEGNLRIQPWFAERYSTGDYLNDYRFDVSVLTTFANNSNPSRTVVCFPKVRTSTTSNELTETQPYLFKYVDGKALDSRNAENDMPIMRLSEVFLIKAEAENELNGPTAIAYAEFNKLRARARNANGVQRTTPANLTAGLTKDEFRQKIVDERALEFVGEGLRWFDLVRMKGPNGKTLYEYQFGTFLPTLRAGLPTFTTATNTWAGGRTDNTSIVPYNAKLLLWPIPFNELSANPNITQNPGY